MARHGPKSGGSPRAGDPEAGAFVKIIEMVNGKGVESTGLLEKAGPRSKHHSFPWRVLLPVSVSPRLRGLVLLNLVCLACASAFVVLKESQENVDPFVFQSVRFIIAAAVFSPLMRKAMRDERVVKAGAEIGFWAAGGYLTQSIGMLTADASRGAFLSGFTVVVVPLMAGLFGTAKLKRTTWVAVGAALVGISLLEDSGAPASWGDFWSFVSAVLFGAQIYRAEHYSKQLGARQAMPMLSICLLIIAAISLASTAAMHPHAVLHLLGSPGELRQLAAEHPLPWLGIIYMGCGVTNGGLIMEVIALQDVTSTEAAIIYTLEPVFGAGLAYVLLGERWGASGWVGAGLIIVACLIAQLLGVEDEAHAAEREKQHREERGRHEGAARERDAKAAHAGAKLASDLAFAAQKRDVGGCLAQRSAMAQPVELLTLPDGRRLAFKVFGAALQAHLPIAVLYFHGTPSCHLEAEALDESAKQLGLPVVAFDRSGIGLSDGRWRGSSLRRTAADAAQLAGHLGLQRLIVIGCSGGGPFAAAFACFHPELCTHLALIAALGPTDWAHVPLLRALKGADFLQLALARLPPLGCLWGMHSLMAYMAKSHTELLLEQAPAGMAPVDGEALREPRMRDAFARCLRHAYARGSAGVAREVRLLGTRWGLDLSSVACGVQIWQGAEDASVPPVHAHWWASALLGAELHLLPGEGHITLLLRRGGEVLAAAAAAAAVQQQGQRETAAAQQQQPRQPTTAQPPQ